MRKIKVAILGAGHIAGSMAEALSGIKDRVELYAVASRSMERAEAFRAKWGFGKAYDSYEQLAEDEEADLIYVATPHSEHFANASLCITHGRNCLVEKAFCANRKQAEELVKQAKEHGVLLAEAMWTRYQPSRKVIAGLVEEGRIGRVQYIESDFSVPISHVERLQRPELAGGALLDLGIYSLTVPALFHDGDIIGVDVECTKLPTGVDATDIINIRYSDGVSARAKCSCVDEPSNYGKIAGDSGYLIFAPINNPEWIKIYDADDDLIETIDTPSMVNGYEYEVLECADAILEGRTETESMPLKESLRMMGQMDRIRARAGIVYPFETFEDIDHPGCEVWGAGFIES